VIINLSIYRYFKNYQETKN